MQRKNKFHLYIHTNMESVVYNEKNVNWNKCWTY